LFRYIHTTSNLNFDPLERTFLDQYIDNYLYSLISGLQQTSFGFDTLNKICNRHIVPFYNSLKSNQKLFIDSGGYSIIVGDVSPRNLTKFIECYCYFLENYKNYYDNIFSLDIPIFLKYPDKNNIKFISQQNHISISKSKEILDKNKDLYDKFVFVWQFKLLKQYKIWCDLYDTYFNGEKQLRNFGIGGMVGLRGVTNINFSPFIALMYKCLNIVVENDLKDKSIIHMLGVYGLHDRFIMIFLNRLFNEYYLKNSNPSIDITYDTINYSVSGYMRVRNLDNVFYENNNYQVKPIINFSDNEIENIIENDKVREAILEDLHNLKQGKPIKRTHLFAVINVVKQLIIDKIMEEIVYKDNLYEWFVSCDNYNKFKGKARSTLSSYENKYPFIFQNRTNKNLLNFQYIFAFHNWFKNERDNKKRLETMIQKFIKHINFPFDIEE